jgi:23S rRNA (cytosine1962-C5)-methyltransferase
MSGPEVKKAPYLEIEISARAAAAITRGQLWIFSNEIFQKPSDATMGSWCHFVVRKEFVAFGYFNPHSLIAGRVVSFKKEDDIFLMFCQKLETAFSKRLSLGKTARLFYSEGDFLPGLIIDSFNGVLVVQPQTAGIEAVLGGLLEAIEETYKKIFGSAPEGLIVKADSGSRTLEHLEPYVKVLKGKETDYQKWIFEQDGVLYAADLIQGQKSGFFLDQKANRDFMKEWILKKKTKSVLDLCSYSGGWGLSALKAGSERVTFVDESKGALELVKQGLKANKFSSDNARLVQKDVFEFLELDNQFYDLIILDPPAFVKSKKHLAKGLKGYEKLNRLAWRRLNSAGLLMTCSCSFHVQDPVFLEVIRTAVSKENGWAHILYHGWQAGDHPVLLSMPETHYLKCYALEKIQ